MSSSIGSDLAPNGMLMPAISFDFFNNFGLAEAMENLIIDAGRRLTRINTDYIDSSVTAGDAGL